jgi:hypothetical protein
MLKSPVYRQVPRFPRILQIGRRNCKSQPAQQSPLRTWYLYVHRYNNYTGDLLPEYHHLSLQANATHTQANALSASCL